jgi:hypothetical protein
VQLERLWRPSKKAHWRGLHYAIVMSKKKILKPNREVFENTEEDWKWLSEVACKAARWLGYIPFDRVIDRRNSEPIIHRKARVMPEAWVTIGIAVDIPDADDIEPRPGASGFVSRQAYQFVIFGEKGSLEDVLLPLARKYDADLYLPTGEISDTLLYRMAKDAVEDGRPLIVFTVSDCDPAGHQMPISIARKLQALRDLLFPDLRFEVVPTALTPEQARELGLPSTPLKEGEKRASRWKDAFGIEQTEVDALTTPEREHELREIVDRAFDPYFDRTLEARVSAAEDEWLDAAQAAMSEQIDNKLLSNLREQAATRLSKLRKEIDRINKRLRLAAADHVTLPEIDVPEPEIDDDVSLGLARPRLGGGNPSTDRAQVLWRGRRMSNAVLEAIENVPSFGRRDAAAEGDRLFDVIIEALRRDPTLPARSHFEWALALADLRLQLTDEIAGVIVGHADLDEVLTTLRAVL